MTLLGGRSLPSPKALDSLDADFTVRDLLGSLTYILERCSIFIKHPGICHLSVLTRTTRGVDVHTIR